ncbi:hypothetical protein BU14_0238s0017 [Porphyra umbilicalis]|uniref:Uncharacterized protein n=1 Tax=Porphyra umbilicalis TaxID=2786 RepID=A0A1X6P3F0_PORUM|nr:hypothetical protein BU14_0238s0017 [Porphyra umbilicalis]|eukprot:OSX75394.1 hypothetical protein BU14_0238s0017 [Porphyra umbilicalis]
MLITTSAPAAPGGAGAAAGGGWSSEAGVSAVALAPTDVDVVSGWDGVAADGSAQVLTTVAFGDAHAILTPDQLPVVAAAGESNVWAPVAPAPDQVLGAGGGGGDKAEAAPAAAARGSDGGGSGGGGGGGGNAPAASAATRSSRLHVTDHKFMVDLLASRGTPPPPRASRPSPSRRWPTPNASPRGATGTPPRRRPPPRPL